MAESTLTYPFSDLYKDVAEYAGLGRTPTGDSLALAKRRVNDAYRRFLAAHDWHFLKMTAVLTTEGGKYRYNLPDDFSTFTRPFTYPPDDGWWNPYETDASTILATRTGSGTTSGRPYMFAIRTRPYTKGEGTRWEVIFHYQPDAIYQLTYSYRVSVDELVDDGDKPIGGPEHAQTLRSCCLAEVESFDEEKPGTYTGRVQEDMARSIKLDAQKGARFIGLNKWPLRRRQISMTYNSINTNDYNM